MFTQKHYEFFAKFYGEQIRTALLFKESRGHESDHESLNDTVNTLVAEFEEDNERFKPELFRKRVQHYVDGERE